jgi:hypothetical protein
MLTRATTATATEPHRPVPILSESDFARSGPKVKVKFQVISTVNCQTDGGTQRCTCVCVCATFYRRVTAAFEACDWK